MNPAEIEQQLSQYRQKGASEAALAVIRERLSTPVASAPPSPAALSYQDKVAEQEQAMREDEAGPMGGIQSAKNAVGAFGGAAFDTGTLGYGPKLVGGETGQAAIEAARQVHPVAGFAGDLTGAVVSPITKGLGKLATGIVGKGAEVAAKMAPKAAAWLAATDSILARGSAAAVKNIAAGGIGGAGFAGAESNPEDADRIQKALGAVFSPENAILGVGIGVAGQKLRVRPGVNAQALRPMIDRYERVTGERIPVSIYTDSQQQQRTLDAMARVPELSDDVARLRGRTLDGMRTLGRQIADDLGAGAGSVNPEANAAVAAGKVREMAGKPVMELPGRGSFSLRREAIQGRFFNRHGQETATEPALNVLGDVYKDIGSRRTLADKTGDASPLTALFAPILKAHKNPITLNHLESIRKELADVAFSFNRSNPDHLAWGKQGPYEASRMYGAVVETMNQITPAFERVNKVSTYLHRIEESVKDVPQTTLDDGVMNALWRAPKLLNAWSEVERGGNAADIGTLRGDYFHRLMVRLQDSDGLINPSNVRKVISEKTGMFNRQNVQRIVPGALEVINDYARLSESVRGAFPAENSRTASRGFVLAGEAVKATQLGSILVGILTNRYTGLTTALGVSGIKQLLVAQSRSMINGHLADTMQRMARGGYAPTTAIPGIAAQAAGQFPGAMNAGTSVINDVTGAAGSAFGSASNTMFTPASERGK